MLLLCRIIAALAGIERGIGTANEDYAEDSIEDAPLVFVGGRVDCPDSPDNLPNVDDNLPSAHWGSQQVFQYFDTVFDLNQAETVALMGAHTMGVATEENVGFNGVWTGPTATRHLFHFDGTYHHILRVHDYGWTVEACQCQNCVMYSTYITI